jgi:Astacin (Peptidase family M12A)
MDDRITGGRNPGDEDPDGEHRSSPTVRTALVDGIGFTSKALQYADVGGVALFEGDILLGRVEDLERDARLRRDLADDSTLTEAAVISGERFRWPGGVVPYEIDPALTGRERITGAIAHWEQQTRIRFVERTAANADQHPDYVRFVPGDGCASHVGRQGGGQDITVGPACTKGNLIHELFHAVGGWHEQSREDRDKFVTIQWANIKAGHEHNFNQHIADGDDVGPYDYDSIMHYPRTAFSSNGQDTIVPTQEGAQIGQRNGLSAGDIAAVSWMYPALEPSQTWTDVHFRATVPAGATRSWFTRDWPAYWYVRWSLEPVAGNGQPSPLGLRVQLARQSERLVTYYLVVSNLGPDAADFGARYEVLGWPR